MDLLAKIGKHAAFIAIPMLFIFGGLWLGRGEIAMASMYLVGGFFVWTLFYWFYNILLTKDEESNSPPEPGSAAVPVK